MNDSIVVHTAMVQVWEDLVRDDFRDRCFLPLLAFLESRDWLVAGDPDIRLLEAEATTPSRQQGFAA